MLRRLTDMLHITSPAPPASVSLEEVKTERPTHNRTSTARVVLVDPMLVDRSLAGENLSTKKYAKIALMALGNYSLTTIMILPSAVFSAAYATGRNTSGMVWPYVRDLRGWPLAKTIRNFASSMAINYFVALDYFGDIKTFRKKKQLKKFALVAAPAAVLAFIIAHTGYTPVIDSLFSVKVLTESVITLLGCGAAFFAYVTRYGNIEEGYSKTLNWNNKEDVVFSHNVSDLLQYRINKELLPQIKNIFEKASIRYGLRNIKVRGNRNKISIDDDGLRTAKGIFISIDYDIDLIAKDEALTKKLGFVYRAAKNAQNSYLTGEINNDIIKDALTEIDQLIATQPLLAEPIIRDLTDCEKQTKNIIRSLQWILAITFFITANPVFAETIAGTIFPLWLGNTLRALLGNFLASSTGFSYANVGWEVAPQTIDALQSHALTQGVSFSASVEVIKTGLLAVCAAYSGAGMAGLAHDKFYNNTARAQQFISLDETAPLYSQILATLSIAGIGAGAASFNWKSIAGKFKGYPGPHAASIFLKRKHAGNEPLNRNEMKAKIPHLVPYLQQTAAPSTLRRLSFTRAAFPATPSELEPLNPAENRSYGNGIGHERKSP